MGMLVGSGGLPVGDDCGTGVPSLPRGAVVGWLWVRTGRVAARCGVCRAWGPWHERARVPWRRDYPPAPAVEAARFQDETEPYPRHWRAFPESWPPEVATDPDVAACPGEALVDCRRPGAMWSPGRMCSAASRRRSPPIWGWTAARSGRSATGPGRCCASGWPTCSGQAGGDRGGGVGQDASGAGPAVGSAAGRDGAAGDDPVGSGGEAVHVEIGFTPASVGVMAAAYAAVVPCWRCRPGSGRSVEPQRNPGDGPCALSRARSRRAQQHLATYVVAAVAWRATSR